MNCPMCGSAITTLVRYCSSCRADFGEEFYDKFAFYYTWKSELDRLMELQNSLFAAVKNVSEKIRKYEDVLRRDLATLAESSPRARKKAVQTKNQRR